MGEQCQYACRCHEPENREGPAGLQGAYQLRGEGAEGHLGEAGPACRRAGHAAIHRDGARRAVGNGEAVAEGGERHGDEERGGRKKAGDGGGEAEEAAADSDGAARHDHAVNAELYRVAAGEEISCHVGGRDGDEPQAVFHGGALQHIHHDVGSQE